MFPVKFIYDLTSRPTPKENELNEEIDRLLYLKTAEQPTHLEPTEGCDYDSILDSQVVTQWIRRRFEPALLLLLLGPENYYKSKAEVSKMERYQNFVDKLFRAIFLERQAKRRIEELCFDDLDQINSTQSIVRLKKTLTFLAGHLNNVQTKTTTTNGQQQSTEQALTLFGTKAYTQADISLYNYLKRTIAGKFNDSGLKSHIKHCEALIKFMQLYAKKNVHVIDITSRDPTEDDTEERSLVADMTRPIVVVASFFLFYLWMNK